MLYFGLCLHLCGVSLGSIVWRGVHRSRTPIIVLSIYGSFIYLLDFLCRSLAGPVQFASMHHYLSVIGFHTLHPSCDISSFYDFVFYRSHLASFNQASLNIRRAIIIHRRHYKHNKFPNFHSRTLGVTTQLPIGSSRLFNIEATRCNQFTHHIIIFRCHHPSLLFLSPVGIVMGSM